MYKRDVTVIDIASSGSNFSEILQKYAFVAKRSLITMTTATAGSCTVIDGNDSQWHKKTHKLYSKNDIGNVPGHYIPRAKLLTIRWYDLMSKKIYPSLCNNYKTLSQILNQILNEDLSWWTKGLKIREYHVGGRYSVMGFV